MAGKRDAIARLLDVMGANRLHTLGDRAPHAIVLNYHRIAERRGDQFDRDIISASPSEFAAQLDHLKANFECLTLAELSDLVDEDKPSSKGRRVVITFDDGYADNANVAAPMLAERGLPAAFFLTSGFLDDRRPAWWDEIAWIVRRSEPRVIELPEFNLQLDLTDSRGWSMRSAIELYKSLPRDDASRMIEIIADRSGVGRCPADVADGLWMTWDDARRLAADGFDIGGHTVSHPVLSRLTAEQQAAEAKGCYDRIAAETGVAPRAFSYPVGQPDSFTPQTRRAVAAAGFDMAFSFYGGLARAGHVDRFNIPRVAVEKGDRGRVFRTRVAWPQIFA